MNKLYILLIFFILSSIFSSKYESNYYRNTSNILDKYPKVDIDYIFTKQEKDNNQNVQDVKKEQDQKSEEKREKSEEKSKEKNKNNKKDEKRDSLKNIQLNSPFSNIFQKTFYDYYQTSLPLYDEKMKCYFPIKKNISLDIDNENNFTKIKNISKFYGKSFIKSLKGKCERFYVERWYYTLCPLVGAKQTLSYIKPDENKKKDEEEKQEVNYLGYQLDYNDKINESLFLENYYGDFKNLVEEKYSEEILDIKEENLFNNYGKKNQIIGIHKNVVKFFGENVFNSNEYINYSKIFVLEYTKYDYGQTLKLNKKIFKTNIIKTISNNIILLNKTLDKSELLSIKKVLKIKILKNENYQNISSLNQKLINSFFNQTFFIYDQYLYSSKLNLILCVNMNCHVTISNDNNFYALDTIVDTKLAKLDKPIDNNKDLTLFKEEYYCIFYGNDILYFYGKGTIDELTRNDYGNDNIFIIKGKYLDIYEKDEILLIFNDTEVEFYNYIFINDILSYKFISLQCLKRFNETHVEVKINNKLDLEYIEKDITLDSRYIKVKNNIKEGKKDEEEKKEEAKYVIIGNSKNISLDNNFQEKKEKLKIENFKEEYNEYKIPNKKEFVFNFDLYPYNFNLKDSFITICFSNDISCKSGEDYEIIIDIGNNGLIMQKINDININNSLIYSKFNFKYIDTKIKSSIIYFNSTIYFNSIFKDENNLKESEIKLKCKIKNESYVINYIIINQKKSKNIYIESMNFEEYVSYDLFKNIFLYEQKFLLDDNTIYIDTFENGDYCQPIKAPRRVIIYYTCDEEGIYELKLTNVFEDKKDICVYHYYAKSKYLCNPNMLMKNYLKFSGLKTYCYLDN